MSAPWSRDLSPLVYTDDEDYSNSILIQPGTTVSILSPAYEPLFASQQPAAPFGPQLRPFFQSAIASLGMAWDAAGNNLLTWSLAINGRVSDRYLNRKFAIAPPFGDAIYLPQPLWVPQQSRVDLLVTLSAAATGPVNFTGRIIALYFLQDPNLARATPDRAHNPKLQGPPHVGTH